MVFEAVDTAEKAWLLGWIATDGSLTGRDGINYQVTVRLKDGESERKVCELFKRLVGGEVYFWAGRHGTNPNYKTVYWQLNSRAECEHLVKLGILRNKSLILGKVAIPEQFLWAFVRGAFEGDGSVWLRKGGLPSTSFTSGSKEFSEWLAGIVGATVRETPKRSKVYYSFGFTDRARVERLYHGMYDGAGEFVLERKRDKLASGLASYMSHEQRSLVGRANAQIGLAKMRQAGQITNIERFNASKQAVKIACEDCHDEIEARTWNRKVCDGCSAERNRRLARERYAKQFILTGEVVGPP